MTTAIVVHPFVQERLLGTRKRSLQILTRLFCRISRIGVMHQKCQNIRFQVEFSYDAIFGHGVIRIDETDDFRFFAESFACQSVGIS